MIGYKRSALLVVLILSMCQITLLAQGETRSTRIALVPTNYEKGNSGLGSIALTLDSVLYRNLILLEAYDIIILPPDTAAADPGGIARATQVDYVVFSSASALKRGFSFSFTVYRADGSVEFSRETSVTSAFSVFDEADTLALDVAEKVSGTTLRIASVTLDVNGQQGSYSVSIDGRSFGKDLTNIRLLAGTHRILVTQARMIADYTVLDTIVNLTEGEEKKVEFTIPLMTPDERREITRLESQILGFWDIPDRKPLVDRLFRQAELFLAETPYAPGLSEYRQSFIDLKTEYGVNLQKITEEAQLARQKAAEAESEARLMAERTRQDAITAAEQAAREVAEKAAASLQPGIPSGTQLKPSKTWADYGFYPVSGPQDPEKQLEPFVEPYREWNLSEFQWSGLSPVYNKGLGNYGTTTNNTWWYTHGLGLRILDFYINSPRESGFATHLGLGMNLLGIYMYSDPNPLELTDPFDGLLPLLFAPGQPPVGTMKNKDFIVSWLGNFDIRYRMKLSPSVFFDIGAGLAAGTTSMWNPADTGGTSFGFYGITGLDMGLTKTLSMRTDMALQQINDGPLSVNITISFPDRLGANKTKLQTFSKEASFSQQDFTHIDIVQMNYLTQEVLLKGFGTIQSEYWYMKLFIAHLLSGNYSMADTYFRNFPGRSSSRKAILNRINAYFYLLEFQPDSRLINDYGKDISSDLAKLQTESPGSTEILLYRIHFASFTGDRKLTQDLWIKLAALDPDLGALTRPYIVEDKPNILFGEVIKWYF